jgi:hypothetical protein
MNILIIIVNYNSCQSTVECLTSLDSLKYNDLQIKTLVVDNKSEDATVQVIRKDFPQVLLIENKKNEGFAEGNNIGLRWGLAHKFDYFLILNNDTVVSPGLLINLIKAANQNPKAGLFSPKIYFQAGFEYHLDRYNKSDRGKVIWYAGGQIDWKNIITSHKGVDEVDKGQYDNLEETDFATGCCMFIKKEVLEKIGLFNPKYFLYWEDTDLSWRAIKAGYKVIYTPEAFLWHKNAGSTHSGSYLHDYYLSRNRLLFGWYYASFRTKIALFRESVRLSKNGRKGQRRGIKDFLWGHFGPE